MASAIPIRSVQVNEDMEEQNPQALSPAGMRSPALRDVVSVEQIPQTLHRASLRSPTVRDLMTVIFRHRTLIATSFLAILIGVVVGTWLLPKQYEAQVKILVKRERADPIMTPDRSSQSVMLRDITPEDLNSEVELIKSRDLLEKVVIACGLHTLPGESAAGPAADTRTSDKSEPPAQDLRVARAVGTLEKALAVEVIAKSKLIEVRYSARDPRLAAKVLETLTSLYLEKHVTVHRPAGAFDFLQQQTDQYKKGLAEAEKQLAEFSRKKDVVSIEIEKDIVLRKLSDFETQLRDTQTAATATEQRIKSLETQAASRPPRVVTQVRTTENPAMAQQLRASLLTLELKRTELLTKYEPGYRAVQEVDTQIAQTREALAEAEKDIQRDETTDLDTTRQWLDSELARARAELVTLKARSTEIAKVVEAYRVSARQIGRTEIEHVDLVRSAKTAEENYLLYLRKQEEARISDELDRKRIVNVAIAEAATVPAFPSRPRWDLNLILGLALAILASLGLAFVVDYMDPSFRTPDEVEGYLGLPVLAATPRAQ
jgi:uncharacterized protein involved in exopolysaccharide biosynthesis